MLRLIFFMQNSISTLEVAVIPTLDRRKLQHAVIRVGHALRIVHRVAAFPYHFLMLSIFHDLHRSEQHRASEKSAVGEVQASLRGFPKLHNPH